MIILYFIVVQLLGREFYFFSIKSLRSGDGIVFKFTQIVLLYSNTGEQTVINNSIRFLNLAIT